MPNYLSVSRCCFQALFFSLLMFASTLSFAVDAVDEKAIDAYATAFWNSFNTDLATGDLEQYLSHWHEHAERITPTVHARGIKQIRATYESYLAAFSDFQQTELRRLVDGNVVVSELLTTARNKQSGKLLELPNVAILEFAENGKVKRARVYMDTQKFNPQAPALTAE